MSHSQFHSKNLFILRHAWLNLWDKHMTTGRINQVTTFQNLAAWEQQRAPNTRQAPMGPTFLQREFVSDSKLRPSKEPFAMQLLSRLGRSKPTLFPDLTSFRRTASCLLQQKWWPSEGTTCDRRKQCCSPSRGGFPSVLIATSLAISKKSTSLSLCKQQQKDCVLDSVPTDFIFPKLVGSETIGLQKVHSKPAYPVSYRDASLIRHRTSQPIPSSKKAQRHTQCYFNLHTSPLVHTIAHIEVCSPTRPERLEIIFQLFRLFLLMVGNPHCLVLLCLIFTRRDKVCPQYRVRNLHDTDHLRTPQKLFRPLAYTSGISKQFCLSKNDEDLTQPLWSHLL
jgi:hypothetical protein